MSSVDPSFTANVYDFESKVVNILDRFLSAQQTEITRYNRLRVLPFQTAGGATRSTSGESEREENVVGFNWSLRSTPEYPTMHRAWPSAVHCWILRSTPARPIEPYPYLCRFNNKMTSFIKFPSGKSLCLNLQDFKTLSQLQIHIQDRVVSP